MAGTTPFDLYDYSAAPTPDPNATPFFPPAQGYATDSPPFPGAIAQNPLGLVKVDATGAPPPTPMIGTGFDPAAAAKGVVGRIEDKVVTPATDYLAGKVHALGEATGQLPGSTPSPGTPTTEGGASAPGAAPAGDPGELAAARSGGTKNMPMFRFSAPAAGQVVPGREITSLGPGMTAEYQSQFEQKAKDIEATVPDRLSLAQEELALRQAQTQNQRAELTRMQQASVQQSNELADRQAKYDAATTEAQNFQFDPDRYFKNRGVAGALVDSISSGVGTYLQIMGYTRENEFQKQVNAAIDRDIASQQAEYQKAKGKGDIAQNAYSMAVNKWGNETQAALALRGQQLAVIDSELMERAAKANTIAAREAIMGKREMLTEEMVKNRAATTQYAPGTTGWLNAPASQALANQKKQVEVKKTSAEADAMVKAIMGDLSAKAPSVAAKTPMGQAPAAGGQPSAGKQIFKAPQPQAPALGAMGPNGQFNMTAAPEGAAKPAEKTAAPKGAPAGAVTALNEASIPPTSEGLSIVGADPKKVYTVDSSGVRQGINHKDLPEVDEKRLVYANDDHSKGYLMPNEASKTLYDNTKTTNDKLQYQLREAMRIREKVGTTIAGKNFVEADAVKELESIQFNVNYLIGELNKQGALTEADSNNAKGAAGDLTSLGFVKKGSDAVIHRMQTYMGISTQTQLKNVGARLVKLYGYTDEKNVPHRKVIDTGLEARGSESLGAGAKIPGVEAGETAKPGSFQKH